MIDLTGYTVRVTAPSGKIILVAFGSFLEEFDAQFTREAAKVAEPLRKLADMIEAAKWDD